MIVLFERGSAPRQLEDGLASVFNLLGHSFVSYDPNKTATFDAFDKTSPNLYIGSILKQPRAVKKCLAEFSTKFHATEAIPAGADIVSHKAGSYQGCYTAEVVYVGGYDESIAEHIQLAANHFNLKIFQDVSQPGPRWGMKNELGVVNREQLKNVYASSRCSLAFSDPYKVYEILLSGGFPLADKSILSNFSYAYGFSSPEGVFVELNYILREKKCNNIIRQTMLEDVLRSHTYFHRVFDIFFNIKKPKDAAKSLEFYYDNFPIRK